MSNAIVGLCTFDLYLPGVASLKEKRSIIKPLLKRLRDQFNISASEVDYQDVHQSARIAVVLVTNDGRHAQQSLDNIIKWIETHFPDAPITRQEVEIL